MKKTEQTDDGCNCRPRKQRKRYLCKRLQKIYPDKMKIVAIADIDPEKVKLTAEEYDVPMSHCYESAEDMLKEEKSCGCDDHSNTGQTTCGSGYKSFKERVSSAS